MDQLEVAVSDMTHTRLVLYLSNSARTSHESFGKEKMEEEHRAAAIMIFRGVSSHDVQRHFP